MPDDIALSARLATPSDVDVLVSLYRQLEEEQTALKDMWPLADGLAEPIEDSVRRAIDDAEAVVVIGEAEEVPFGFVLARIQELLPQAGATKVGAIRLIFTEHEARGVGIGETMIGFTLDELRRRGLERFDAHVLPGHRHAKNFFEASGFAARSIIMYHRD
ncbi:MAG: GNAT family N-acetyltransferase [Acidimicrobiia bacterium]|nr:GNAT family N-acetyltransferase [Acidimicrobiia bacterium]